MSEATKSSGPHAPSFGNIEEYRIYLEQLKILAGEEPLIPESRPLGDYQGTVNLALYRNRNQTRKVHLPLAH